MLGIQLKPAIQGDQHECFDYQDNFCRKPTAVRQNPAAINALIKSGVDGLLDILPAFPSTISGEYSGDVMNVKTEYIGTIEGHIAFKKSIGEDTAFLQKVLEKVKRLDGSKLPSTIDERV